MVDSVATEDVEVACVGDVDITGSDAAGSRTQLDAVMLDASASSGSLVLPLSAPSDGRARVLSPSSSVMVADWFR